MIVFFDFPFTAPESPPLALADCLVEGVPTGVSVLLRATVSRHEASQGGRRMVQRYQVSLLLDRACPYLEISFNFCQDQLQVSHACRVLAFLHSMDHVLIDNAGRTRRQRASSLSGQWPLATRCLPISHGPLDQ